MLALFDQHPGHLAADLESHIGRFRTFDRTTGAHRFGPLHNSRSSDLNRHGHLLGSHFGLVAARRKRRSAAKHDKRREDMFFLH
jgi:hypothetical protein